MAEDWDLAEKLYRASYGLAEPDSDRIQPLGERAQWEQEVWLRVADAAMRELKEED